MYIDSPSWSLPEALFTGTLSSSELRFCVGPFLIFSQIHSLTFSTKMYFPGSFANYLLIRFSSWKALAGDWSKEEDREFLPLYLRGGGHNLINGLRLLCDPNSHRQVCLLGTGRTTSSPAPSILGMVASC